MKKFHVQEIAKSPRIDRLKEQLFAQMPELEADRAVLLTESYRQTEDLPMITRRAGRSPILWPTSRSSSAMTSWWSAPTA